VLIGGLDSHELMSVPSAGDDELDVPQVVSRATIANIIRHRAEEIFEMVRDRLADSPFAAEPKARVVLSGGASQLTGTLELATRILNRPVRIGRPLGFSRLRSEVKGASFAVPAGLLVYPQYAHLEHVEPRHTRQLRTGTDGYFGKVGRWLREGF
jgi:cell division protein FtsA